MGEQATPSEALRRLTLARDQLDCVIAGIGTGQISPDTLRGLADVARALDGAGYQLVASSMRECLSAPTSDGVTVEQLEALFITLA